MAITTILLLLLLARRKSSYQQVRPTLFYMGISFLFRLVNIWGIMALSGMGWVKGKCMFSPEGSFGSKKDLDFSTFDD